MAEKIEVGVTVKGTKDATKELNALDQGIKNAGSGMEGLIGITDKFTGGAATGMIKAYKGTLTFIKGLKLTKVALISTGIGAIVVLVGALVGAFLSSEKQAKKFKVTMAGLGAVVDRVKGYFKALGGFIVGLFTGGTQKALKNYNKEMDKLPGSMTDAIKAAKRLEIAIQNLVIAQRLQAATSAKASLEAKKLLKDASDINKTTEERIDLIKEANAIEQADFDKRKQNLMSEVQIIKDEIAQKGTSVELEDKLLALYSTRFKLEEEQMNLTATGLSRIQTLKDAEAAAEQQRIDDAQAAIDAQKVLDDEADATQKAKDAAKLAAQIKLEDELYALSLSSFERAELALQQEFDKRSEIAGDNEELQKAAKQRLIDDLAALQLKADEEAAAAKKAADDKAIANQAELDAKKIAAEEATAEAVKSARMSVVTAGKQILGLMSITEEGQKKLAIAQILVNQGIAMSNAVVAGLSAAAKMPQPAGLFAAPGFVATAIGIALSSFASIKGVMNQAGAAAEGVGTGGGAVGGGGGGGLGVISNREEPILGLTPDMREGVTPDSIPPINAYVVQSQLADQNALAAQIRTATTL
jgi:hypothetical protein